VSIIRMHSLPHPKLSQFIVSLLWPQLEGGHFTDWMLIMLFFTVTFMKKYTCLHRQGFEDKGRKTWCVDFISHCIVWSKHLDNGSRNSQKLFKLQGMFNLKLTTRYSPKTQIKVLHCPLDICWWYFNYWKWFCEYCCN
jgi:hypothetical protein